MHRKFEKLLHEYKVEVFHADHDKQTCDEIAAECLQVTDEVLKQNYRYHFHQLPDANRAEIINMISNYTREALLPPVVEKLVERQLHMEKRMDAIVHLTVRILEALSEPSPEGAVNGT